MRPVPLTAEEQKDYRVKDSTEVIRRSRPYQDSMDRKRNEFEPISLLLGGYTHVNSFKKTSFSCSRCRRFSSTTPWKGPCSMPRPPSASAPMTGGISRITPVLRYGFSSTELNPSLELRSWQLHPARRQQIGLRPAAPSRISTKTRRSRRSSTPLYTLFDNRNYAKLYRRDGAEAQLPHRAAERA